MTAGVQLRLFEDTREIACPHCGHRFDPRRATQARRQRVLQQLALAGCSAATHDFVGALPGEFWSGGVVGVMALHRWTGYHPATVLYHLSKLVRLRVVETVPKRPGGSYSLYRLAG